MAGNGERDEHGRFVQGAPGGPGRGPRLDFVEAITAELKGKSASRYRKALTECAASGDPKCLEMMLALAGLTGPKPACDCDLESGGDEK